MRFRHAFWSKYVFGSQTRQPQTGQVSFCEVREFVNKSAASAASPDYVQFQAVIKSAASTASPQRGRASGRLPSFRNFWQRWQPKNYQNLGPCFGATCEPKTPESDQHEM